MRKLIISLLAVCTFTFHSADAQTKTQSIIYDAVTILNAKYGLNALLIPSSNDFDIHHPLTSEKMEIDTNTRNTLVDSLLSNTVYSKDIIYSILKRNAGLPDTASENDVKLAYSKNPFIKSYLDSLSIRKADFLEEISRHFFGTSSGGLGGNILGNLVNGTADFLIKRAQEEISISVFEKLKQFITRYPEFDTLFPRTCALIKPVNAYEYSKALQAFKDAIHEDLKIFIPRISLLYDIPRYKLLNERVPSLTLVFSASALLGELHDKSGFAESLYKLGQRSFINEKNNYANFLKLLTVFSNSLLDKKLTDPDEAPHRYVQVEFIKLATHNNPVLWRDLSQIYLGLIWQNTSKLNFSTSTANKNFGELLEHWAGNPAISKALETINTTLNAIVTADNELGALKNIEVEDSRITGKPEIRVQRFTIYANLVSQLLGITELYINPANTAFSDRIKEIRHYLPAFTTGIITMIKDFQQEEYSLGLSKLAEVLKTVSDFINRLDYGISDVKKLSEAFEKKLDAQKHELDSVRNLLRSRFELLNKAATNPDIEAEKQELLGKINEVDASLKQVDYQSKNKISVIIKLSKVIEYVNLLAAITKAENSAAVEALLETYALPAGSSRIKKVSAFNFAVNAYVGAFFGRSKDNGQGFTNNYGLTAPIGLTLSSGLQRGGSFSLFAGIFDIGGTIRYKLDNQGKYQQDISLAGIVSPGLHIVYGFPFFIPFSAGVGCQWISPVTTNTTKIDLKAGFNAFIAVDIPLFNIANTPKKNKP